MTTGISLIADERLRQIQQEGWTPEHDDQHDSCELAKAAACYALPDNWRDRIARALAPFNLKLWPWEDGEWRPNYEDRIRELVKAGALISAEIDRLQRLKEKP